MAYCKICNNENITEFYEVKEMMFGIKESFTYFICNNCNCLQILSSPPNMDKYYSQGYYSHKSNNSLKKKIITQMAVWRDRGELFDESAIGKLISKFIPSRDEIKFITYLKGVNKKSKILDIGSGIGFHLKRLAALGFTNLRGIDPFLKQDSIQFNQINIFRLYLDEYEENDFDLITLHHTFEHLPNPKQTLELICQKLNPSGYCCLRIPTIPNEAWDIYKENWFQIDAPRHFFIHSPDSIAYLCRQAGFTIEGIIYDSVADQFYISEMYQKGIPLIKQKTMSKSDKEHYSHKATVANKLGKGDQAIFILKK